jgi:hypothetical protein
MRTTQGCAPNSKISKKLVAEKKVARYLLIT